MISNNIVKCAIIAVTFLMCFTIVYTKDYCCMPRGHKVSVRDSTVKLSNCNTEKNCALESSSVMVYTHYPDLDNYRYRIDFHQEYPAGQGPFPEGTTLGFITDKRTLLGYEYVYNSTACVCRRTTRPSGIYHITCVSDDYDYVRPISIGVGLKAQLYTAKQQRKTLSQIVEVHSDNVAQIFDESHDTPLCALIHEETTTRTFDANSGALQSLSIRQIDCSDFTPRAFDVSYKVPYYCPPAC